MRKVGVLRVGVPILLLLALWLALSSAQAESAAAVWPEHPGDVVESSGKLLIDASHADLGYVMACVSSPSSNRMKMRVTMGKVQLTYDLDNTGEYETFPLQLGSGKYEFALYENVKGTKYSSEGQVALSVQLSDENAAYLCPNQYVDYELLTAAVQKSDELCAGSAPDAAYQTVCNFMTDEFVYDFVRAKTISPGELPDIDGCYERRSGICQDLSAVMVCMLRVQGIPAKLVIGYADKYYHAWTMAVVNGEEIFFDPTAAINALKAKKYQVERMY